ncbi:MAG: hypothetical protein KME45_22695 [Stenomitos rutilans HA7619-LM2]|jgi:hypothetical protein|nr:hypothetical protein [Stenomitos rutilans HA7619-LM2]
MLIRIAAFSFALFIVTGCSVPISTPTAKSSNQATNSQTSRQTTALPPKSQRFASDRQNQLDEQGYRDGYEDGSGRFPSNSNIGLVSQNITDEAEKKIYIDAYNRGYAQGKGEQPSPSPSPSPTSSVSPDRKAELQRRGYQEGSIDAQSNFASNPGSGIAALGLTNPTEIQIYTDAYNAGYQQRPSPSPSPLPTISPGRLSELRQQGRNNGYADAQANLPRDPNNGINQLGLVTAREQQAYTNGYRNGYQEYLNSQQPPENVLW